MFYSVLLDSRRPPDAARTDKAPPPLPPQKRPARRRHWIRNSILLLLALVALLIVCLPLIVSTTAFRNFVSRKVTHGTGREFKLAGAMHLHWGLPPLVEAEGVQLANVTWGTTARMLDVSDASVTIDLSSVFFGERVKLPKIALSKPVIVLEKSPQGQANWTFNKQDETAGQGPSKESENSESPVEIGDLMVDDGTLVYKDPNHKIDVSVKFRIGVDEQGQSAIHFDGGGKYNGLSSKIEGTGGSVLSIHDDSKPYPIDGKVTVGKSSAQLKGTIQGIAKFSAVDLHLKLKGDSMADLFPIIGVTLPPTPPYQLAGQLVRTGNTWRFDKFDGKVGDSDLSGDFSFEVGRERPLIQAKVTSKVLDLDDLGGFVGAEPQSGKGETVSPAQKREEAKQAESDRVLPSSEWRLNRLRAVDADFELTGENIRGIKNPLDNVHVHFKLDNGTVNLDPLDFGVAGGKISSQIRFDAKEDVIQSDADIKFRRLHLQQLFPGSKTLDEGFGIIGGHAKIKGRGNSLAALLGSANGQMGFVSAHGRISELLLQIASLNGGEIVRRLFAGDEQAELRCAVAQFQVRDGVMKPDFLVVDTDSTVITGEGTVDLKNERLDLEIKPAPKSPGILSARSAIQVNGTFKHPSAGPDAKELLVRGGAATLLAFLNPAASLIAFIEPGTGEDQPCNDLIRRVKQQTHVNDSDAPTTGTSQNGATR
ncbi:MAG: AsmA family protein [Bdellovibrionota bacterium]